MRLLAWLAVVVLVAAGLLGVGGYAAAAYLTSDRGQLVVDYGALAAFCAAGLVAGTLLALALLSRLPATVRFPNEWLSLLLFGVVLGTGFTLVQLDRYLILTPLLAVVAAAALFAFIGRVALRWSPMGRIGAGGFVLPAVWGMVGAPLSAVIVQGIAAVLLVGGGVVGLYFADATLMDSLERWIEQAVELTDLSVVQTPTVAFGALSMLGVVAPLTEELAKFLGVFIVFRKRVSTRLELFVAGAAAGLGFAVVETLGYALMAIDQWPQVMLIRAPVAFIHVAATTIVALGWYRQRESGGFWLAGFFALSVLLHAAWNSLFVSMLIVAGDVGNTDVIDPAPALVTLVVVSAMGAVLVAAVMWIVGNARRLGGEAASQRPDVSHIPVGAPVPGVTA